MVAAYATVIAARLHTSVDDLRAQVMATAVASVMWATFLQWLERGGAESLSGLLERSFDVLAGLDRRTGARQS
jgi:hypothetical protein